MPELPHRRPPTTGPTPAVDAAAPGPLPRHMTREEFTAAGHAMVEWIADYWDLLRRDPDDPRGGPPPVLSPVVPGGVAARLPGAAPERGEAWGEIIADVGRVVLPGITHWQHPSFFAFFPANASGPAVLGELLSAGLGVNGMLWATSPAATELETRMLDWMAGLLGLPAAFRSDAPSGTAGGEGGGSGGGGGGCIQGTASESTLSALLAARERARRAGALDGDMVVYTSTQAHSSVVRAAMVAGLAAGAEDGRRVRLIEGDGGHAMRGAALGAAMAADVAAGLRPAFVGATVGTTSSTAVDPLEEIGPVAKGHGAWLHVDAAHAGAAWLCPEHRWTMRGIGHADSVCFNPHKWMLTNFDCDLFWTSDRASLTGALSVTPEYLRYAAGVGREGVIDYRDWHVPLGRRFRALKLWFTIRHYGAEGLRAHVREGVRLATLFEGWVRADGRFEMVAARTMNLVCFRLRPLEGEDGSGVDARNRALLDRLNAGGRVYLTHTTLPGVGYVLRMCVGGTFTREEHVRRAWEEIAGAG